MNILKKGVVAAAGLTAIVSSLILPILPPSGAYNFTATTTGCEVRPEGRQSVAAALAKRFTPPDERADSFERVVRLSTIGEDGYSFGTGYVLGGNFVLTAGHVADKERPRVIDNTGRNTGEVLKVDSTVDLGLVKIVSAAAGKKPSGTRIGTVSTGERVVMKTLDP